jgi:trk system potassium uptake protein TrkH
MFGVIGVLRQFPVFVILLLVSSGLMLLPAVHAARLHAWPIAQAFADHAVFFGLFAVILGLATMNRRPRMPARYHLATLLLSYLLLPLVLALPLVALVPDLGLGGGYFEMLACLTTTGATLFERPQLLAEPLHLWRALVGWMGGLMVLVTAFAILAPLNLGGFEIGLSSASRGEASRGSTLEEANRRILRSLREITPIYAGMTAALAFGLFLAGDRALVAICHAMATLSTSAVSPVGGISGAASGRLGELAVLLFLLPAVSHRGFSLEARRRAGPRLSDPQIQLMLITVVGVTGVLFLRSFVGAAEIDRQDNLVAAMRAIWGSVFTLLSFLTTTGFVSEDWRAAQLWSDLAEPGTILLGVAVMGGGIATTAGGIKLLRLYALYRHGLREMDKLVHPSSVGRRGQGDALISRGGARIAFIFLMLTLIALAIVMIALAATGLSFQESLALAVAGLTTTGPAIRTLGGGLGYDDITGVARAIFCAAMIVGRLEVLVIVALFNPVYWRR